MRIASKNNQFHGEYFHTMCGRVNILAFHRMSTPQNSYKMTAGYVNLHGVKFSRYVWLHGDVSFRPTIIQGETRGCLVVAWNGIKPPWEFLTYYFLSQNLNLSSVISHDAVGPELNNNCFIVQSRHLVRDNLRI